MNAHHDEKPQVRTQNIGDADLSFLFYEGEGPPLILLHATGFLPWLWHPVARGLAGSYRILAPSFCDHRETEPENGGLGWTVLAEDLFRFCRALNLGKPFLVGHSMGATVMMIAHALYGLPAAGMVLIEPILLPEEFYRLAIRVEDHPFASRAVKRTNFWENREEALSYLRSRPLFQEWDEEILQLYLRHGMTGGNNGGLQLACSPLREAALFMGGMNYDPWPLLTTISCPVLILEGEKSHNRGFIDLGRVRSLIPNSELRRVRGAGHLIPMERPREVTGLIRGFFDPLRTAGAPCRQSGAGEVRGDRIA